MNLTSEALTCGPCFVNRPFKLGKIIALVVVASKKMSVAMMDGTLEPRILR